MPELMPKQPEDFLRKEAGGPDRSFAMLAPLLLCVRDSEAKKRALPRPGDRTLPRVDLNLEAALDAAGQVRNDPLAGRFAATIHITVIQITYQAMTTFLKFTIQFIQHDVRDRTGSLQRRGRVPHAYAA